MDKPREKECETKEPEPEKQPFESGYYYYDTTGYKTYDPAADDDDDEPLNPG
jgi:hypothetical protein